MLILAGLAVFPFFPFSPWSLRSLGKQALPKPGAPTESSSVPAAEITGTVRLVGNMPFPQLVITDRLDQDWYIAERDRHLFAGLEQQTVTVQGTPELVDLILANNKRLGVRRILKHIRTVEKKD